LLCSFYLDQLKWSPVAAQRNYETALKDIGAKRVNAVHPMNDKFVERNGGNSSKVSAKMDVYSLERIEETNILNYEQSLVRMSTTNIWFSLWVYGERINYVENKDWLMQQLERFFDVKVQLAGVDLWRICMMEWAGVIANFGKQSQISMHGTKSSYSVSVSNFFDEIT